MISIIVPFYNSKEYLNHCVSSVISQSYQDWELLLVDDGSTDGSGEICDNWAKKDSRLKAIHKENGGVSSARNAGLAAAKGKWVIFLDSDDAIAPNSLTTLMVEQKKHPSDILIYGIKQDSGVIWAPSRKARYENLISFKKVFQYWLNTELLSPPFNKLFKRNLVKTEFRKDVSFGEDLIFNLSYLSNCQSIRFIPDQLYLHNNLNTASITHNFKKNRINDIECWQKEIMSFANDKQDKGIYKKYILDVIKYIRNLYRSELPYAGKKRILTEWYSRSCWQAMPKNDLSLGMSDKVLKLCIDCKLWSLPEFLWRIKKYLSNIKR